QRALGAAPLRRRLHAVHVRQGQPDPGVARLRAVLVQPREHATAPAADADTAAGLSAYRACGACHAWAALDDHAAEYSAAASRHAAAPAARRKVIDRSPTSRTATGSPGRSERWSDWGGHFVAPHVMRLADKHALDSYEKRSRAAQIASGVNGVKGLVNNIQVAGTAPPPSSPPRLRGEQHVIRRRDRHGRLGRRV